MSFQEAIQYRTELHKLAELSGQEIKTAQYIQNKLEEMGFNVRSGVGGHGLVVDIDSGVAGPMVMLRADIDALPYADPNDPERIEAIHACGHDAHAAILLAAAPEIRKNLKKGKVRLAFQPAEESLQGALAMIKDGVLDGVDIVVGSHIRPVQDLPFGKYCASVNHVACATVAVTVIGPAGENLLPMSVIINAKSHTGGGIGGVWGSKNLKGLAIDGDQPIHIAADKEEWEKLVNRNKELLGALTQTVVSRYPHPLFEYHSLNSRWSGMPGKQWGAANPPINVPLDTRRLSKMAFRTNAGEFFLGDREWARHVRNNGCFACPIRCYPVIKDTATAAKYNVHPITEQTCGGLLFPIFFYPNLKNHPERNIEIAIVGSQLMDDLGLWCNYGQLQRDMIVMYQDGYWKKLLSKEEYDSLPWKKIDDVDASAMQDFLPRIAYRKGEFGKWLGETTPVMLDHFGIPVKTWSDDHRTLYWSNGHPKHHTNEDDGQLGCVLNCMWNRDPMAHAHVNFTRSGLPIKEMKHIAKVTWGDESAVDQIGDYTPTNTYKMKRLQWVIARTELHNMLGLCSWMAPWEYCPDEKNQYVGDPNMEAKIFSAVTGVNKTGDDLDKDGIRAWMLQRVYTMRQLGSSNMRKDHDLVPGWIYTDPKDRKPFTKGTVRMDPDDINKSFDIFFEQVGCDKETGVPTTDTLKAYRLDFVIPVLQKEGLIK